MTDSTALSRSTVDQILRRAAEIDGSEDAPVSVEQLRSIAGQAGFAPHAVEQALAEVRHVARPETMVRPVQKSGLLVAKIWTMRSIPIQISSDQLMNTVRLFQPYREGPAQVKLEDRQITWRDRKGIRFAVVSSNGVTEISVFVSRPLLRRRRMMSWVRAAADRLESIIRLVADADSPTA